VRLPWRRGDRASSLDLLVVGLGNPGREYARNRHNAGAMIVDELARRHGGSWRSKFSGQLAEVRIDGHRVGLLKPETYMNESGRSVQAAARFFKV
jgi:PTH1 family peptidyl-tRNA hydrolase